MSHPLTDALPDHMDALALRQACGEIEERVTRERDEARDELEPYRIGVKHLHEELDALTEERDALRAEVERLRGALHSLAAVARRYLPDYDEHPEIQRADAALTPAEVTK